MTNQKMQNSPAYKTYLAFATRAATPRKARKFKKHASTSKKKSHVAVEEPTEKPVKKPATRRHSIGVQIRDTPCVSVSNKKTLKKAKRSKGFELLSKAALLEEVQLKNEGTNLKPRVPNVPKADSSKNYVSTDDENVDDEKYDRINKKMYDDVNVELKDTDEGKEDEKMTNIGHVDSKKENSNQETKKTSKDIEPSKKAKSTKTYKGTTKSQPKDRFKKPERPPTLDPKWNECKTVDNKPPQKWFNDLAKAKKPSKTFDDLMCTPIDFNAFIMNHLHISDLTQDILVSPAFNLLKGTCWSYVELEYIMEECYKALNDQLDWNNPEGDRYPFNLSKPLPLIQSRNHHIVPIDYFFNNDLAYLEGGSTGRTYTTSLTKRKAAKYDLQGIEDMVPNLWSPVKVSYNINTLLGASHWRSKRQTFYGYASNRVSKHDVYSTKIIMAVTNVKVNVCTSSSTLNVTSLCIWPQHYDKLKDMFNNMEIGYTSVMLRRKRSNLDKKRSHIMVKDIDRRLLERRLMRILEKFVGRRDYGEDLRLLQRTI
nr:hypothetical protein [Tanacetum cinerariifolium]